MGEPQKLNCMIDIDLCLAISLFQITLNRHMHVFDVCLRRQQMSGVSPQMSAEPPIQSTRPPQTDARVEIGMKLLVSNQRPYSTKHN